MSVANGILQRCHALVALHVWACAKFQKQKNEIRGSRFIGADERKVDGLQQRRERSLGGPSIDVGTVLKQQSHHLHDLCHRSAALHLFDGGLERMSKGGLIQILVRIGAALHQRRQERRVLTANGFEDLLGHDSELRSRVSSGPPRSVYPGV